MALNIAGFPNLFEQGMNLLRAGKPGDAEGLLAKHVQMQPSHWQGVYFWGVAALEQGKWDAAIERLKKSLQMFPKNPSGHYALADVYRKRGMPAEALASYDKCLELDPECQGAWGHRGWALVCLGRLDEAAATSEKAIGMTGFKGKRASELPRFTATTANPWNPAEILAICLYTLGQVAEKRGQIAPAAETYGQVVEFLPKHFGAWFALAEIYYAQQRAAKALEAYDRLIEIEPGRLDLYLNRGVVLARSGRFIEAGKMFEHVIAKGEGKMLSNAHRLMGRCHSEWGNNAAAFRCYREAWRLDPTDAESHSCWLRMRTYLPGVDMKAWLEEHREWWRTHAREEKPEASSQKPEEKHETRNTKHETGETKHERLRVGFVSPDFRWHSVAYFLMGLFEHFDRTRFEFFGYNNSEEFDGFTTWFKGKASGWREIQKLSDREAAELIRQDGIDVLVDLAGHTARNRLRIFSYKPAPVQVTWLGCPSTTGSELVDWRVTDRESDPEGMTEGHYAEKLWRMERPMWCFRAVSGSGVESPRTIATATERAGGATGGPFTFGSFAFNKTTPEMMAVWVRILKEAPGSRLCLKSRAFCEPGFVEMMLQKFEELGIGRERVMLKKYEKEGEAHLAAYREVDLSLDTYPYNGTTNTCEALWMGVPVLTLAGEVHASRVGVSLLKAVGLEELIARNEEEYVEKAVRAARDAEWVAGLRKDLRGRMERSALMDERGFAADFCTMLESMATTVGNHG